ncbi:DUF4191 domain-containing protein [Nocardioides perillae]|uniref:DUF4191 domain-containing protein n=1 Tax=Nocardioides perillae TaxID=1119534 RepID=A0A7Y9RUL9_9ACTN|nr:DUF4191 domain-containing protein [Nocardioides perillae]NYG55636.1 hypothetical protein [Nocardioides perillae]
MSTPAPGSDLNRRQQIAQTYRMTKRTDPRIGLWVLGAALLGGLIGWFLFWLLPGSGVVGLVFQVVGAFFGALIGGLVVFGRRAQRAAYAQIEGQRGAAAAALQTLRRGWKVDPVVAFTKQQDVVHRVVGPPGIVLVGEGNHHRLRTLMTAERRKHERVVAETPVHEVVAGSGEGEVPIPKLVRHVQKLGKGVKGPQLTEVLGRLRALDANRSSVPLPKGPVPQNMKGMRQNMRGR